MAVVQEVPKGHGHGLKRTLREIPLVFKETAESVWHDDGFGLSAEAAFAFALSLFPLFLLIVIGMGLLGQDPAFTKAFADFVVQFIPAASDRVVESFLRELKPNAPTRDIILSSIFLLWPASSVFNAYIKSTIRAYNTPDLRSFLKTRLLAIALVFATGGLFLIAFLAMAFGPQLARIFDYIGMGPVYIRIFELVRFPLAVGIVAPTFAFLYHFGPDHSRSERRTFAWPGAFFATFLWIAMSVLFSFYLDTYGNLNVTYGALTAAIVLLIWMYLSSLAVISGAEFNMAFERAAARLRGQEPPERRCDQLR
jgi:membrane protein